MPIEAIVFDMDDTLYCERDYVVSGFKAVHAWMEKRYKITNFYEIAINVLLSGEKKFVFNKTLQNLCMNYDEILIQEMIGQYRNHDPNIHLLDDAKWVLNHLNPAVKIGLISDGFLIAQEKKVNALGLRDKIQTIILTDQWGRESWKPSRIPYEKACLDLGIPHHQCVYVGDNVSKDFITARRLGWTTVHIVREEGTYFNFKATEEYSAHYCIHDLKELSNIPVLKHLFRKQYEPIKIG